MWDNDETKLVDKGFNLSILECKYGQFNRIYPIRYVLIYPYWNVNTSPCKLVAAASEELNSQAKILDDMMSKFTV